MSQFLNVVQEICQTQSKDPRATLLVKAKNPISSSMGTLFIMSQTITSAKITEQQLVAIGQRISECANLIESGIQQVIEAVQKEVEYQPELPLTPVASTYIGDVMSDDHMSEEMLYAQMKRFELPFDEPVEEPKRSVVNGSSSASVVSTGVATPSVISTPSIENAWFLAPDGDSNDMVYTAEGNVKGGTLHGLVQHLTQHDQLGK
jgi:son of sevenless-like protein